jgi:hypothetical protein
MACADVMSAVCPEQDSFASLLIKSLITFEFWFLKQAQLARPGASVGQESQV